MIKNGMQRKKWKRAIKKWRLRYPINYDTLDENIWKNKQEKKKKQVNTLNTE